MKVLTILGARPQFIKAAAVSRIIKNNDRLSEVLVHTGQHFDTNMSEVFFSELEIPVPDYNLGISGGNHGEQTGKMLQKVEEVLLVEKPDLVMVYGDTNSTLAGALAAVKLHIPIAHVEAGLRSFNKKMPEEINRILTDHCSDILLTPSMNANKNLRNEGIEETKIHHVGDVMYDAAIYYGKKLEKGSSILSELKLEKNEFILATIHRAENVNNLEHVNNIFESLEKIAKYRKLILPIHPRTKKALESMNYHFDRSKIIFLQPVGFLDMIILEKFANLIITDSGGVQKEAFFHKTPCITLRNQTEWIELVENGFNFLAEPKNLIETMKKAEKISFTTADEIFGNGNASEKIVNTIIEYSY